MSPRLLRLHPGPLAVFALAVPTLAQEPAGESGAEAWGAAYFPNVPLVTHEGKTVRFFDDLVKDKVVVINFIYTSCVDACPLETARLAEVQEVLGERVGQDVFMYSISIDPKTDTPAVLAEYVERFQIEPGWTFLTGEERDITELRQKLGLYIDLVQPNGKKDHNLSVVIGNQKTGRWMKTSPFENSYVLAAKIGDWVHNWKAPRPEGARDFAEAPELRMISRGESLFRTRCSTCHVIGPGDGKARQGPNLMGVMQRRERDWLARWIAAPDEMLAAGDPIATGLFEAFNKVQMPNLRLNELEVSALIEYLETEGARVAQVERVADELPASEEEGGLAPCCQKQDKLVIEREEAGVVEAVAAAVTASPSEEERPARRLSGPMLDETLAEPLPEESTGEVGSASQAEPTVDPVTVVSTQAAPVLPAPAPESAPARRWHVSALSKLSIAAGLLLGAATLLASRRGRGRAAAESA
jgi:cytochrome oxidase Cu insertion factor (SCO1/SenC/PrrC family)